eukprot:m.107163 g.107163  ORF g.107163 m.107163 type:complete len:743 (+) comp15306_c0_seq1:174-2402(+)
MERVGLEQCMQDRPELEKSLNHFSSELADYGKAIGRLQDLQRKQHSATTKLQSNNDQFSDELLKMIQLIHSIEAANGGEDDLEQSMRGIFGLVLPLTQAHKDEQESLLMGLNERISTLDRHFKDYCQHGKNLHRERKLRRDRYFKNLDKQLASSKKNPLDMASLAADKQAMQKAYLDYVCHINYWLDRKSQLIGEQLLLHVKSLEVYHRSCAESCQQVLNKFAELSSASHSIIARADKQRAERQTLSTQLMKQAEASQAERSSAAQAQGATSRQQRPFSNPKLTHKAGWLYLFRKGIVGGWVRVFGVYHRSQKSLQIINIDSSEVEEMVMVDACVQRFSDDVDRKFVFEVTSSEGKSYLLQAINDNDRQDWMSAMRGLAPTKTIRRKTKTKEKSIGLTPSGVAFLQRAMAYIEREGINETGIYRVPGQKSKTIKLFNDAIDRGRPVNLQDIGISTCASTLKHYLRVMDPPLLTFRLCDQFAEAAGQPEDQVVMALKGVTQLLPGNHYQVAVMLFSHLNKVAANSATNSMTPSNLGTCFGPSILRREESALSQGNPMKDMKAFNLATELMIRYAGQIFGIEDTRPASMASVQSGSYAELSTPPASTSESIPEQPEDASDGLYVNLPVPGSKLDYEPLTEEALPPQPTTSGGLSTAQSFRSDGPGPPPSAPPRKRNSKVGLSGRTVQALYDCVGDEEDELSFGEGDLITSVVEEEDEWLQGVHVKTGILGLFPEAYVTGWEAEA